IQNLVVYRTDDLAVMLNRYPYTNGHMLVIPRLHIDSMTGLPAEFRRSSMDALVICEMILRKDFMAQGVNVGLNLGEAAGAGIADHLHWHILPRWYGDTNFSTVVGRLRVVPETLEESFARIFESFKQYT
ncbi:MAG: HIT domain-containing protein, partial [Acidobacteriota bacterium]